MLELDRIVTIYSIRQRGKTSGMERGSYVRVICKGVQRKLVEKLWVLDVLQVVFSESTV